VTSTETERPAGRPARGAWPRGSRAFAALCVLGAALSFASPWLLDLFLSSGALSGAGGEGGRQRLAAAVSEPYTELWRDLATAARRAAEGLPEPEEGDEFRRRAFRHLIRLSEEAPVREDAPNLILIDPDGEAVAWSGEGLLAEPDPGTVAPRGFDFLAAFGSVTWLAVEPLEEGPRPWRLVAGRSFATDRWPFRPPLGLQARPAFREVRWALVWPETPVVPEALVVRADGGEDGPGAPVPTLVVLPAPDRATIPFWHRPSARLGWGFLAALLLVAAAMWVLRVAFPRRMVPARSRDASPAVLLAGLAGGAGAFCAVLMAGGRPIAALVLGGGLALAAVTAVYAPGVSRRSVAAGLAAAGSLVVTAGAWALLEGTGGVEPGPASAPDLASRIWPGADAVALRLGLAAAAFALFLGVRNRKRSGARPASDLWAWSGLLALLAAGAAHDLTPLALALLAGGAAAWSVWIGERDLFHPMPAVVLALAAALVGSVGWETAARLEMKRELGRSYLDWMAPPEADEMAAVEEGLQRYFAGLDLAERVPRSPEGLARDDLAFFLWRQSPLARANALSALAVEPLEGAGSAFGFGAPVAPGVEPEWGDVQWIRPAPPVWEDEVVSGEAVLRFEGRDWGLARYWLLPRPGFGLVQPAVVEPLELDLLRGRPAVDRVRGLPEPAVYALYDPSGRAFFSPWTETPPLPTALVDGSRGAHRVETPSGPAWAWARRARDGIEVIFLPMRAPGEALERVGTHALGTVVALGVVVGVLLLLALPRPAFQDLLRRTLRSYSKRLIIVFTCLLLVPLLLLNLVILSDAEERLNRTQRAAGEAAMVSAQRLLGDWVGTFDPGFSFATVIDDALLKWVSRLVHHEVNLYWGSSIWASSKPELFAADLLPERIPGEAFSRLTLQRYDLASRTNVAPGIEYLELYAPFRISGGPLEQERLFLSLPLLAQQEEVARELASLRRRVILSSAALFGLLIAVGVSLARRFSQPLEELVEGTRRIAAGAPSLDLPGSAPSELELAALVEAIDEMAGRIAESRERLVREKEVVDRMVESITSGVVSLDRENRVVMCNRVAEELLGVTVGERLDEALARSERLAPVAEELARIESGVESGIRSGDGASVEGDARFHKATVHLAAADGGEDRDWTLVRVPVPGRGEPTALLVVEDATEVLRGHRLQAWAEMARIIAHEIKNPLTPLRLSTEHLREVFRGLPAGERGRGEAFEEVFERCTANILSQVDELRSIATEFSAFSSIPTIEPVPGDLAAAMGELVAAYGDARTRGVEVSFERSNGPEGQASGAGAAVLARFDPRLLGRAVRNLIENAVRATAGGGRVVVRVAAEGDTAAVSVLDSGPGVAPELLARIFDPYFSTHDTGTGLGLPIARRIAEEHGGSIAARNRPDGGLEVTVRIPS
jgi:signal transduction histidine kinase